MFLVTPNPVFRHYIDNVLPDLGERNPETLTWDEFAKGLLPPDRGSGDVGVPLDEFSALSMDEQLRIFHEFIAPADEQEERALALRFLNDRYADAYRTVERELGDEGAAPLIASYDKPLFDVFRKKTTSL